VYLPYCDIRIRERFRPIVGSELGLPREPIEKTPKGVLFIYGSAGEKFCVIEKEKKNANRAGRRFA
jgi:hypothetical protein